MRRQTRRWCFLNKLLVGASCLTIGQAFAYEIIFPEASAPVKDEEDSELTLKARTLPQVASRPPAPPTIKGNLKDFTLPDEARFWEIHGVPNTPALKRAVERLSEHLIGSSREKTAAFRYCEARAADTSKEQKYILTPEGISCLYYRWQRLLSESKRAEKAAELKSGSAAGKKVVKVKMKKSKGSVGISSARDLKIFADAPYDYILKRIEFRTEALALRAAQVALENPKDCSLTSARAAVLRDLENHLPSDSVWRKMNELYDVTTVCLSPDHEAFEIVNLRLALLHLDRKNLNRAASLLEVVLQGKDLKDEHSALFWRGFLEYLQSQRMNSKIESTSTDSVQPRNLYWDKLIEKHPLTLHSLVVDHINGVDTYERYAQRPAPQVSVYQGQDWTLENVSHLMAGIFMAKKKMPQLERLARLLDESSAPASTFESALFRVKFFEAAGNQRAVIKIIWSSLKTFGSTYLTEAVLELLYPVKFRNEIASQASYIDPALIFSLIRQESSFNPKATSPAGAQGLMQVMPSTARKMERRKKPDLYEPSTNIRIGSKYLSYLRKRHQGDYARLIASYNAGPRNTEKWDVRYSGHVPLLFADTIPFPETRHYVNGLMRHMYWYRALVSHLKETPGSVKINWSWSLQDVVPKASDFGLKMGEVYQVKIDPSPWLKSTAAPSAKAVLEEK